MKISANGYLITYNVLQEGTYLNRKISGLLIIAAVLATIVLPSLVHKALAASTARTDEDDAFVPAIKAVIQVNYTTTSGQVKTASLLMGFDVKKAAVYEIASPKGTSIAISKYEADLILHMFSLNDILTGRVLRFSGLLPSGLTIFKLKTLGINTEINLDMENHGKHGDANDEWSAEDLAPGIVSYEASNNSYGYKYTTATVLDIPDVSLSDNLYYYLYLYEFMTVDTGSNSKVYIGWENSTDNTKVIYDSGHIDAIYRDEIEYYWFWINASARPTGSNAKIKTLKFENMQFSEFKIKYRDQMLDDHRTSNITITYGGANIFSASKIKVEGTWIDNFVAQVQKIPATVEDNWKSLTSAWGWENLDKTVKNIAESALEAGQTFKDYTVKSTQFIVKSGKDIGKKILDTIEDFKEGTAVALSEAAKTLNKVKKDVVHSVTLAIDVGADSLKGLVSKANEAGKGVVDATHGFIAGVAKTVSGAGEFVVGGLKGLVKTVGSGVKHFTDGVVGVFNGIKSFLKSFWWVIIGVGAFILIMIGLALYNRIEGGAVG